MPKIKKLLNSKHCSKPPSSDIVKPPPKQQDRRRKRKIGAQKGHPQHLRTRLLDSIQAMYRTIHRRGTISDRTWHRRMLEHRELILQSARCRVPLMKEAQNLSERLWKYQDDYFRFIESGVPSTNNLCEQSIRRVVLNRKVTQGTRSDWGNRWWERIWSVLSTCEQRVVDVMTYLQSCVASVLRGRTPPMIPSK